MEPVPRLWAVPSVPRLDELSRLQHGSVLGLAGCRMLLVSIPGCSEVMSMEGGHRAAPCPMRAKQMPLCGVHRGAGTRWYPLTAVPGCPRAVEERQQGCSPCGASMPLALPRRALQHTNLLQCLAQCAEVTPYLLVMEFCPLVSAMALQAGAVG